MHDLGPATRELARVAAQVGDDDLDRPTPCGAWTVRDLLGHLLALTAHFASVARHAAPERGGPPAEVTEGWRAVLDERLADLAVAWTEPGAWEGEGSAGGLTMPNAQLGVVALEEIVLHGWDLARSVGAGYAVRDEDVETVGGFVAGFEHAGEEGRAGLYGPVVDADPASELDRVLALAGRDPHRPLASASG
ncbi:TIGR03086 family metal-binding protein [Actinomycetospora sp. CA-101289]|uniref:TIGR03086 family metal-binding protein n=1 Tax=Actinomycetospora sp. CA-101289 TaxID=3239893 RepID=UPI003D9648D3